ncbi:MAG: fructose-bisphosphate aldolase [Desulfobacteraceae bacterium]|nr:fructose-bisphosphate aldolase [Desulfobacteraceae bacterium]
MSGKTLRMKRIVSSADGCSIIFPLDHGVSCGPISGLECLAETLRAGIGGADAIVLHKGMLRSLETVTDPLPGIIMHLSASTNLCPTPHRKVLTGTVEEAVQLGADAVSLHVNLGDAFEHEMLRDLGIVSRMCSHWQIPLLVMTYACRQAGSATGPQISHAARVAAELGADIIKLPFPGDYDMLAAITSSLPVPVVIAGGVPGEISLFLDHVEKCIQAGAKGVAAGRSIFQRRNPRAVMRAIRDIVHGGMRAEQAAATLPAPAEAEA